MHRLTDFPPCVRPASAARRGWCVALSATALNRALTTVLGLSQAAGCGGSNGELDPQRAAGGKATPSPVAFETALAGNSSGITAREAVVVRNAGQWDALWGRHATLMVPPPPPPAQDFSGRQMVGLFAGSRPDGCYGVTVTAVVQQSQAVIVLYREQRAGSGEACTQAITQPHHLVWIPASSLPVEFKAE